MEQQQNPLLSRVVNSLQYRSSFASGGKLRSTKSERNELESDSTTNKHFNLSKNSILVGREEESRQLQECMNRIIEQQSTELVVIHGISGCGKSSLVQSFARNLPPEALYVEGKFDQLQSHAPYSALVAASDQICRQILNKKNCGEIRDRVRSVLGPEVNLLGNLIPKLLQISEDDFDQVSIPNREEDMGKSFQRFKQLFRSFLRSVASSENPLVLFLDDVQWADHASLDVLKSIITDTLASNILIICSYREGEISMDMLQKYSLADDMVQGDDAESSSSTSSIYSARITDIFLGSLDAIQLNELMSIKLEMDSSSTISLSQLIWKKTNGIPFYVLIFLENIHRKGLLSIACNGEWNWDESQIMQMTNVSQNLASILETRMKNLPEQVRSILQMASFIGHEFPIVVLITIVYEEQDTISTEYSFDHKSKETIQEWITSALNVAVTEGLLEKLSRDDEYKFAHDKIQEALYEGLMPDEMERKLLHQRIGTLIWNSVKDKDTTKIDDSFVLLAADNLNRAACIVDYLGDRYYLIELNLVAAKRIINKSAFLLASEYLRLAISLLLPDVCWDEKYDLCLDLFNTAAETEKNIGCYSRSADMIAVIHQHAKVLHHRSTAFVIEMDSLTTQGYMKESIILGLNVLRQLGIRFPRNITNVVVVKELFMAKAKLGRRKLKDLLSLTEVADQTVLLSLSIMKIVALNAFILGDVYKETYAAICLRMFRFTLKYGISKMHTPIILAFWGSIHAALGEFDVSIECERLSFVLIEKYDMNSIRGTTIIINLGFNHFWRKKFDSVSRNELFLAYKLAMSYGYINFALLGFNSWVISALYLDDHLSDLHQVVRSFVNEMRDFDLKIALTFLLPLWQVLLNLSGDAFNHDPSKLRGEALDEAFACTINRIDSKLALMCLHIMESIANYVFNEFKCMPSSLSLITKHRNEVQGHFSTGFIQTWLAIFHYESYLTTGKIMHRRLASRLHRRVHYWSKTGTEMLIGPTYLLDAMAQLCMRSSLSEKLVFSFEEAAKACDISKCRLFEALAYERLAKVLWKQDPPHADRCNTYHKQAVAVYRKWGAIAKAEHLEQKLKTIV